VLAAPFVTVLACGSAQLASTSTSPDASVPDAEPRIDGSNPPPIEAGPPDCSAQPFDGAVTWLDPAPLHQGLCTLDEIATFRDECLVAYRANDCNAFLAGAHSKRCAQCILTLPAADAAAGPVIDHTTRVSLNVAGCIAEFEDAGAPCAHAFAAHESCLSAACDNLNPQCGGMNPPLVNPCYQEADQSVCASYLAATKCVPEAGAPCVQPDFTSGYDFIAPLFCADPDAGTLGDASDE
jgi:hypothetical protein